MNLLEAKRLVGFEDYDLQLATVTDESRTLKQRSEQYHYLQERFIRWFKDFRPLLEEINRDQNLLLHYYEVAERCLIELERSKGKIRPIKKIRLAREARQFELGWAKAKIHSLEEALENSGEVLLKEQIVLSLTRHFYSTTKDFLLLNKRKYWEEQNKKGVYQMKGDNIVIGAGE